MSVPALLLSVCVSKAGIVAKSSDKSWLCNNFMMSTFRNIFKTYVLVAHGIFIILFELVFILDNELFTHILYYTSRLRNKKDRNMVKYY